MLRSRSISKRYLAPQKSKIRSLNSQDRLKVKEYQWYLKKGVKAICDFFYKKNKNEMMQQLCIVTLVFNIIWAYKLIFNKKYIKEIGQRYLARKSFKWKVLKSVYLSLFIFTNCFYSPNLILFTLNKLMVSKRNKPIPGDHESSFKILNLEDVIVPVP